jgi:signal transduction histidine kinase
MKKFISANLNWVFYLVYYILIIAVINRELPNYLGTKDQIIAITLFSLYPLLMGFERLISRKFPKFIYFYFVLQLAIVTWLLLIPNDQADQDYFINLVIPLCGQAIWYLRREIGWSLVAGFSLFCLTTMVLYYKNSDGLSFGLTYVAGCILVSVLSAATLGSINAQKKSQELAHELTLANEKLKEYSLQVEELAVADERNRLARELHDSVTQIIFGMTLSAQAARILIDRDPLRAAAELDNLQTLSQNALAEMRSLIQELHPHTGIEEGLISAIKKLTTQQLSNNGIVVDLQLKGERRIASHIETELFRIIQEAINNIIKHAQAKEVLVMLDLEDPKQVSLTIKDDGVGFDPAQKTDMPGHLGLTSIQERVRNLGGTLNIDSNLGKGTSINVVISLK